MKKKLMALFLALSMAVSLVTPAIATGDSEAEPQEGTVTEQPAEGVVPEEVSLADTTRELFTTLLGLYEEKSFEDAGLILAALSLNEDGQLPENPELPEGYTLPALTQEDRDAVLEDILTEDQLDALQALLDEEAEQAKEEPPVEEPPAEEPPAEEPPAEEPPAEEPSTEEPTEEEPAEEPPVEEEPVQEEIAVLSLVKETEKLVAAELTLQETFDLLADRHAAAVEQDYAPVVDVLTALTVQEEPPAEEPPVEEPPVVEEPGEEAPEVPVETPEEEEPEEPAECGTCGEPLNDGVCALCNTENMVGYTGVLKAGVTVYASANENALFKWTLVNDHNVTIVDQFVENGALWYEYEVELAGIFDPALYGFPYVKAEDVFFGLGAEAEGVEIAVNGMIPADVKLTAEAVEIDIAEYGIENEEDVLGAFDISLMQNGEAWQPVDHDTAVAVELDAKAMGLEDGDIVALHHNHEGEIETFDTFVVIDGKITFWTDKFSIYVVSNETDTMGTQVTGTANMNVGDSETFYYTYNGGDALVAVSWSVSDESNAISYTVYDNGYVEIDSDYVYAWKAPWIKVTAKDAGTVTLTAKVLYRYNNAYRTTTESFTIQVSEQSNFHIVDNIAETGCLVPSSLTDVTYTWERSDGQVIRGEALNADGSVNVSLDRGGVTNNRAPITYTVNAYNAEGTEVGEASFEVIYGNEILNPSFENPDLSNIDGASRTHMALYNGYEGLYWKTTAPGTGNVTGLDVELVAVDNGTNSHNLQVAANGKQFAELNAEDAGTLYQDVLTTSGATFNWSFSHAARQANTDETMYIVIAATKDAQNIVDSSDVKELLEDVSGTIPNAANGGEGLQFTHNGGTYHIWKHTSNTRNNPRWTPISGTYTVPDDQYLTRLFFASASGTTEGNFIDDVSAGETMSYKIEYYVDGFVVDSKTQSDDATVYTNVALTHLQEYTSKGYVLTGANIKLEAGDVNYPGDVTQGLFITSYGDSGDDEYAVILKVYLAESAVTITKNIVIEGWNSLTDEQKTALIGDGLTTEFALISSGNTYTTALTIIAASSTGTLTAMGEFVDENGNAPGNGTYTVTETSAPEIEGYTLAGTEFDNSQITISNITPTAAITCTNTYKQEQVIINYVAETGGRVSPTSETLAVYTGNAQGSVATPDDGYKFVGWYDSTDAKVSDNATFIPQKVNGKNVEATYHAKFEQILVPIQYVAVGPTGATNFGSVSPERENVWVNADSASGSTATAGNGFRFVGWYTDNTCETAVDASWVTGNKITPEKSASGKYATATYYAKFEHDTTSLTITKTAPDASDNERFIFNVSGPGIEGGMQIVLKAGESKTISGLKVDGVYTVTEDTDWSWRYKEPTTEDLDDYNQIKLEASENQVTFNNEKKSDGNKWLSAVASAINTWTSTTITQQINPSKVTTN